MFTSAVCGMRVSSVTRLKDAGSYLRKYSVFTKKKSNSCGHSTIKIYRCKSNNVLKQLFSYDVFWTSRYLNNVHFFQARNNHFKAAVLKEFEEKLEIEDVKEQKKLKEKQVRVKIHCCAVNVTDSLLCSGKYEPKQKLPFVPGHEFSGIVQEVGSAVKGLQNGDKVIGLNKQTFSALAEQCIIGTEDLWKIPQDVSFESAAALVDSYATVLLAARRANLKEGDTVLVTAAAGGLGLAAVDIASNLFKTKVIGACDTEDNASLLRDKGAFSAIIYGKKEVTNAIMKATNSNGVQTVIDAVGGDLFEECLRSIAPEGSVVVVGFASHKVPQILINRLLPKSCALIGVSLTHYKHLGNDIYRDTVQEIIDMYLEDFISPYVAAQFDFQDVNDAFKFIEDKKSTGKVIVNIC